MNIFHNNKQSLEHHIPLEFRYQIATDFEPVDARSAFPCFDEPAQKASWENDVSKLIPDFYEKNYKALSQ